MNFLKGELPKAKAKGFLFEEIVKKLSSWQS